MVIDARGRINSGAFPLVDRLSFEHKALASLKVSVEGHTNLVLSDLKRRADFLDARHPCSTYLCLRTRVLWKILCPDLGALSRFLLRLQTPCGLHRARAVAANNRISRFQTGLHVIFSMHKRALVRRIGLLLCRGWAQHIFDR